MIINKLMLNNFRSYDKLEIEFSKNINIIIGNNGAGKTNIIESIYLLGITKSFLTNNEDEIINFNSDYLFLRGNFIINSKSKILEIGYSNKVKRLKINNTIIKRQRDYISKLNIVLFSSMDLNIIKGQPSDKRKFLNIDLSQINNKYLDLVNIYNKVLKQRNSYLKTLKKEVDVDYIYYEIITNELINISKEIVSYRLDFLNEINKKISDIYNNISLKNNKLELIYQPSISYETTNEEIIKEYKRNIKNEIKYKTTNYGIHRDSFIFNIDKKDISLFASSGQQRLAIIALKLVEVEIFKNKTKENPIILLDDVFSELDENKQNLLINGLNSNIQVILTTTDINNVNNKLRSRAKVFTIENSKLEKGE